MARVFTYVIIATGMMLLLNMAGIPTAVDSILSYIGVTTTGETISSGLFFTTIASIFTLATGAGIIIGLTTRTTPESYLIAPLATGLLVFLGTFASVIAYANSNSPSWVSAMVVLVFSPISVGYVLSLVEFWRGTA